MEAGAQCSVPLLCSKLSTQPQITLPQPTRSRYANMPNSSHCKVSLGSVLPKIFRTPAYLTLPDQCRRQTGQRASEWSSRQFLGIHSLSVLAVYTTDHAKYLLPHTVLPLSVEPYIEVPGCSVDSLFGLRHMLCILATPL